MAITSAALQEYFNQRNNRFENQRGMEFIWCKDGFIHTNTMWHGLGNETYDPYEYQMQIITEWDQSERFLEDFKINELADLDKLDANNSWMRYLNGLAVVVVHPKVLEADFYFRIKNLYTTIHSLELIFLICNVSI